MMSYIIIAYGFIYSYQVPVTYWKNKNLVEKNVNMCEYDKLDKITIADVIHNDSKQVITFKQVHQHQEDQYFTLMTPIIKSVVNLRNPNEKAVCRSRSAARGKILGVGWGVCAGLGLGVGWGLVSGIAWSVIEERMGIFYGSRKR